MTTSESEQRDINELLKIKDYSLMSHEEIERVIEYKASVKAEQAAIKLHMDEIETQMKNEREKAAQAAKEAHEAFERAMNLQLTLKVVGEDVEKKEE